MAEHKIEVRVTIDGKEYGIGVTAKDDIEDEELRASCKFLLGALKFTLQEQLDILI